MTVSAKQVEIQLLRAVRSGFVAKGTSLHGWCRQNGVDTSNARKALRGAWSGPKADELSAKIAAAAGIESK